MIFDCVLLFFCTQREDVVVPLPKPRPAIVEQHQTLGKVQHQRRVIVHHNIENKPSIEGFEE